LGLFVFALSSFVPTQRFGALMFTLLTAALVGNLIMLPCVLASPLSFLFGRRLMKQAAAQHRSAPQPVGSGVPSANGDSNSDERTQVRHDSSHRVRT